MQQPLLFIYSTQPSTVMLNNKEKQIYTRKSIPPLIAVITLNIVVTFKSSDVSHVCFQWYNGVIDP